MEGRGLIRRDDCAVDYRGAEVVLTDEGAQAFRSASVPHLRAVRELFIDALTPDQLNQVDEFTRSLQTSLSPDR
jgi:DNA-binding MarR family transcriptional regulator